MRKITIPRRSTRLHGPPLSVVVGGRKRPKEPPKHMFAKYRLGPKLDVAVPASVTYGPKAAPALGQMYANDRFGCCVISGIGHVEGVLSGNASGTPQIYTDDDILKMYSAITGFDPSQTDPATGENPTDQGTDEVTAFQYWKANGLLSGQKLLGWVGVDATNKAEVREALFLFENLFFGVELPDAWTSPMPQSPGFTWGMAGPPDPNQGHCIIAFGYDEDGVDFDTWGIVSPDGLSAGHMPDDAVAYYASLAQGGMLYALLSPEIIANGQDKSPAGFDWVTLLEDMAALGGDVPVPTDAPAADRHETIQAPPNDNTEES